MKTIYTDRLILRNWNADDLDDLYEYAKDPRIGPSAGWSPHNSKEVSLNILNYFMNKGEVWAIEHKIDHKVIGSVGLHTDAKRSNPNVKMIGYVLAHAYWGKGLATEVVRHVLKHAFEDLDLAVVSVCHYPYNTRSKRVIEKCGFHYEGTLRMASKLYDDSIQDDVCYSITKEEYFQQ